MGAIVVCSGASPSLRGDLGPGVAGAVRWRPKEAERRHKASLQKRRRAPIAKPVPSRSANELMVRYLPFGIACKFWDKRCPSVEAARPVRCPICDADGQTASGTRNFHGHGLRRRMVLGVFAEDDKPGVHEISVRRYRCLNCRSILVVGPWDLLPSMYYTLVTVVLALARWAQGETQSSVRARFGAFRVVGVAAQCSWASLLRWAARAARGKLLARLKVDAAGTRRQRAHRAVQILAGAGPPDATLTSRSVVGVQHFR